MPSCSEFWSLFPAPACLWTILIFCAEITCSVDTPWCSPSLTCLSRNVSHFYYIFLHLCIHYVCCLPFVCVRQCTFVCTFKCLLTGTNWNTCEKWEQLQRAAVRSHSHFNLTELPRLQLLTSQTRLRLLNAHIRRTNTTHNEFIMKPVYFLPFYFIRFLHHTVYCYVSFWKTCNKKCHYLVGCNGSMAFLINFNGEHLFEFQTWSQNELNSKVTVSLQT